MDGNLQVSVVIPAYNHGSRISETLSSVLTQRYPNFEVIVVDDGSSDDTPNQVAKYQDRLVYHRQMNRGMAAARNQGIALSQGQLISFLDDDDLWEPNYLETVMAQFEADPDLAAVYTGFKSCDAHGDILPQGGTRVVAPELLYDSLINGGFFPACCLTVRKAVLDAIGPLDETLRGNDDWDLVLRLARDWRVVGIAAPLAIHREYSGGLSSNYDHMLQDSLRAIAKHFGVEDGLPSLWPERRRRAYAGAYLSAAVGHFLQSDLGLGCERLKRAVVIYPPIAENVSTWYDIACSYQPKGLRGYIAALDLERSEYFVNMVITSVIDEVKADQSTKLRTAKIYASAELALGLIAYQKLDLKAARKHFRRVISLQPRMLFDRELLLRYARSLFGPKILTAARGVRQRAAGAIYGPEQVEESSL